MKLDSEKYKNNLNIRFGKIGESTTYTNGISHRDYNEMVCFLQKFLFNSWKSKTLIDNIKTVIAYLTKFVNKYQ